MLYSKIQEVFFYKLKNEAYIGISTMGNTFVSQFLKKVEKSF